MLTESLQRVFVWPSGSLGQVTTKKKNNKKSPRGIGPHRFPPLLGVQIHYGHSRYVPKWYKGLKLVMFLTFDVCAAPPPATSLFHPSPCDIMDPLWYEYLSLSSFPDHPPVLALAKKNVTKKF